MRLNIPSLEPDCGPTYRIYKLTEKGLYGFWLGLATEPPIKALKTLPGHLKEDVKEFAEVQIENVEGLLIITGMGAIISIIAAVLEIARFCSKRCNDAWQRERYWR